MPRSVIYPALFACGVVPLFVPTSGEQPASDALRHEIAALRGRIDELQAEIALLRHSVVSLEMIASLRPERSRKELPGDIENSDS
jgi:hypothetical protein